MNEITTPEGPEKAPERRVKSVNFTDQVLLDYANQRADNLYGGNFSGYVTALIERDRSMAESRRTLHDLEARILRIIEPYGGRLGQESDSFDFEIPKLEVVIEARSRFPRERHLEYQLLSSMQKIILPLAAHPHHRHVSARHRRRRKGTLPPVRDRRHREPPRLRPHRDGEIPRFPCPAGNRGVGKRPAGSGKRRQAQENPSPLILTHANAGHHRRRGVARRNPRLLVG